MRVRFIEAARSEIDEAWTWYEARSAGVGDDLLEEIIAGRDAIANMPVAWQPIAVGVRRYRLKRFPYGLVYVVDGDEIVVLGVGNLHRGPDYWRSVVSRR